MTNDIQLDKRLQFLKIDQETRDMLAEIKPVLEPELPHILGAFYEHISSYPEVQDMFTSSKMVDGAKNAQTKHWANILTGRFDESYVSSVQRIGMTHHRIGLEPRWYIAGYSMIVGELMAVLAAKFSSRFGSGGTQKRADAMRAVVKAAMLDMDFAISIYLEEGQREKEQTLQQLSVKFEQNIGGIAQGIGEATNEMHTTANSMKEVAQETSSRTGQVSDAAAMASGNVQTVAAAAEELTSSIMEISRQLNHSSEKANDAVSKAESANTQIRNLAEAAEKISEVTVLIQDIAEQTNLLALNATIEAARAGDAGKGFAVVAQEVKSLANQTAKATQDIASHIQRVQTETGDAVIAIATIGEAIGEINEATASVSAAVEEQNAAASEIARSAQDAARGTGLVTENIDGVSAAAAQSDTASNQLIVSVEDLSRQGDELRHSVASFLAEVKVA